MARKKGSANLAASLEVLAGAPLDARTVVGTKADLTTAATFPYYYVGIPVYVESESKIYVLTGADPTVEANWKEQGSGSSDDPIIISYADYQALTPAQKADGKVRYVPDYPAEGGGGTLGKAITAAIDVGGIEIGDSFAIGTSYDDMWDALLNPTLYPTFTNPSATLSYSADTYYEVGTSVPAKSATVSLNRGTITPAYGTSGYRSGEATNYALASSGADTEYSDSSASSGSFSVPALTRATKGNIVLTATVSYAAGEQPKDSKGNDYDSPLAAGSKSTTKTMQFIQPYYYGKSSTSTISDFTGLTKSVTAKGQKQFKFTTNNEYMVIAYDSSYGNLSSIIDPNGFETISGWTKSTLTVGGFSYYVYIANSATTDTNAQFTFKY